MNLDPKILQGLLVAAGVIVLLWPALKNIKLPSLSLGRGGKIVRSESAAFEHLLAVREVLEADGVPSDEEYDALETLALAVMRGGSK